MPRVPEFIEAIEKMREIHIKKNEDYAEEYNPFSNFDFSSEFASHFRSEWSSYAVLIGTKIARLSVLLAKEEKPNNESIEDTFIDVANYFLLWRAQWLRKQNERANKNSSTNVSGNS